MDRLTKYSNETSHKNGVCCTHFLSDECRALGGECAHGCKWEEAAWERLAAYEDTGLTPQEVLSMKFEWCAMMDALNSIGGGYTRLRELAEADRDGRLVVLPCKPDGSMLNTSDPERPEIMKRIHFAVSYVCGGIVFHQPYNIFIENVAAGYIRPLNEEAEKALEAKRDGSTSM